ncbi:MAG: hypothetical protein ACLFSQ_12695 [Candidatus Zixiibacteriota bacterium]
MKRIVSIILLIITGFAAFDDMNAEVYSNGLGGITSFTNGSDAIFGNPAGFSYQYNSERNLFATSHYSNYWGLSVLSYVGLGLGYKSRYGDFGIGFRNFGQADLYTEDIFSLSYAKSMFKDIHIGFRFNYGHIDQGSYGAINSYLLDMGMIWPASEKLAFAFLWQNLSQSSLDIDGEIIEIESPISFTMELLPFEWVKLYFDLQNYKDSDYRIRIGQNINIADYFSVNMGISGVPNKFHLGIMAEKFDITLGYSAVFHTELGMTNHIILKYD